MSGRGWTVYAEEIPAGVMADMPAELVKETVNFLVALALEVGDAVGRGHRPPGDPMDGTGTRYLLHVTGSPVLVEYLILPATREIRVAAMTWFD